MSRKIKTTKTAQQRHAEAEVLHASIADQVQQLRNSDAWRRFLDFAEAFHDYSLNNVLLICSAQRPNRDTGRNGDPATPLNTTLHIPTM